MEKSDSIQNLAAALVEAQAEIKVVEKTAENPFFHSKYADLPGIFAEYQRVFPKHGLVVSQFPEGLGLRTTMLHTSGEWMSSVATLNPVKNDPQGLGSAITYMRRYAMASACGIVSSEEDDDGNAASRQEQKAEKPSAPAKLAAEGPLAYKGPIEAVASGKSKTSGKLYVLLTLGGEKCYKFCEDTEQQDADAKFFRDLMAEKCHIKAKLKQMGEVFSVEAAELA